MQTSQVIKFSFYGYGIEIKCDDRQTLDNIKRDFSFFLKEEATPNVFFEVFNEKPDYGQLPALKASFHTPRNICYKQGQVWFIDYFGKGLSVIDHDKNTYKIYSADPHLRHEIVFLSILSLIGQYFDSKHMHRVHSLGLEINNKAVLILLPSGGGKTTLMLGLIKNDLIKLISEDSPLVDASGKVFPFPIRVGVCHESKPRDIPEEYLHLTARMEFGPKYLIDINYFKDKISPNPVEIGYILCGTRCLGTKTEIVPLSKYGALKRLIKDSVVGIGLYQGIEFLFQSTPWELFKKSGILFSRFWNATRVLSKAKTYSFVIGSDIDKNMETFLDFFVKSHEKNT